MEFVMEKILLVVLRLAAILALTIAHLVTGQARYQWLVTYLLGKGGEKMMSSTHTRQILPMLAGGTKLAFEVGVSHFGGFDLVRNVWLRDGRQLCRIGSYSSTNYEGAGFKGRPEAFYLLGGFTFTVISGEEVRVVGADVYDWNANKGGTWFTSPIPKPMYWACRLLSKKYFFDDGVSNELWHDMARVGARPFKTRFDLTVSWEEWMEAEKLYIGDDVED
jgi:hypothetical protein